MTRKLNILLILLSFNTYGNELLFQTANNLYAQEKYSEAILIYDSILAQNIESYEIYYNIGNCYYEQNKWAHAIWNYEKSLKIKKTKKTIQNLHLANLKIIDKIEPLPNLFYKKWWREIVEFNNLKSWQILSILFLWIFVITKILEKINIIKKRKKYNLLLLTSVFCIVLSWSSYVESIIKEEGIILSSTVPINSKPNKNSNVLFSLHAGSKIEIIDTLEDWVEIKIKNGNTGWIKKNNFKKL